MLLSCQLKLLRFLIYTQAATASKINVDAKTHVSLSPVFGTSGLGRVVSSTDSLVVGATVVVGAWVVVGASVGSTVVGAAVVGASVGSTVVGTAR